MSTPTIDLPDLTPLGGLFQPAFISIDRATGTISGTPRDVGPFSPTITMTTLADGTREWSMTMDWPSEAMRIPGRHYCAKYFEFPYREYGAEIVTDPTVYPLSYLDRLATEFHPRLHDREGEPISEFVFFGQTGFEALNDWDRIDVHRYEADEGVTSGHVWRFVDDGVIIGDVELQW